MVTYGAVQGLDGVVVLIAGIEEEFSLLIATAESILGCA